jgi:hypothetical protein
MKLALVVMMFAGGVAAADPPALVPVTKDGAVISVPAGWQVTVDSKQKTIMAKQDPARADAAVIALGVIPAASGAHEDDVIDRIAASLAKDVKVVWRGAPPSGHGHAAIVDGRVDTVVGRMAVIVALGNEMAAFGVFAAKRPDFDAFGGLATLDAVIASAHAAPPPANSAGLVGKWHKGNETLTLRADHTYELLDAFYIPPSSGPCSWTSSASTETGAYTTDGKTLVLVPKTAATKNRVCHGNPTTETLKVTDRRTYAVALATDHLSLTGPGCSSLKEIDCDTRKGLELDRDNNP